MAFAFSVLLYPHPHGLTLRFAFPVGEIRAYHVLCKYHKWVRSRLSAGGATSAIDKGTVSYQTTYLLVQAYQPIWLVSSHDVYQRFKYVDHTIQS